MVTRRIDVNVRIASAANEFRRRVVQLLNTLDFVNSCNFDLRDLTHEQGLELLEQTLEVCKEAKQDLVKARRSLDDLDFNLNHFISRNASDKKKVQGRIDGEAN